MRVLIASLVLASLVVGATGSCTQDFERYEFEAGGAAGLSGDTATPSEAAATGGVAAALNTNGED